MTTAPGSLYQVKSAPRPLRVLTLTKRDSADDLTDIGPGRGPRPSRQVHLGIALGVRNATQQRQITGLSRHPDNIDHPLQFYQGVIVYLGRAALISTALNR